MIANDDTSLFFKKNQNIVHKCANDVVQRYASRGPAEISFRFNELIWNGKAALPAGTSCKVKNVWENRTESGPVSGGYSAHVAANDVVFVILHDCV